MFCPSLSSGKGLCSSRTTKFLQCVDVSMRSDDHFGHVVYEISICLLHRLIIIFYKDATIPEITSFPLLISGRNEKDIGF